MRALILVLTFSLVGTNSIASVIADIQFVLTSYPPVSGAKIHRGMFESMSWAS